MLVLEKIDSLLELYNSDIDYGYEKQAVLSLKEDFNKLKSLKTEKDKISFLEQKVFRAANQLFSNIESDNIDFVDKLKLKLSLFSKILFEVKELSKEQKFAFINSLSYELISKNLAKQHVKNLTCEFIKKYFQQYLPGIVAVDYSYIVNATCRAEFKSEEIKD